MQNIEYLNAYDLTKGLVSIYEIFLIQFKKWYASWFNEIYNTSIRLSNFLIWLQNKSEIIKTLLYLGIMNYEEICKSALLTNDIAFLPLNTVLSHINHLPSKHYCLLCYLLPNLEIYTQWPLINWIQHRHHLRFLSPGSMH